MTQAGGLLARYAAGERRFAGEDLSGLRVPLETLTDCDFTGCVFTDCVMGGTAFDRCDFTEAAFERCNAIQASFVDCDFSRARLAESAFRAADFFRATMNGTLLAANFRQAFFVSSRWRGAKVTGSRFDEAVFGFNQIENSLIVACGFQDVEMHGPCEVDARTVAAAMIGPTVAIKQLAGDPAADADRAELLATLRSTQRFFTLAGVDREMIKGYAGGVGPLPGDYESAFISYSGADEEFARTLQSRLRTAGVVTWFAPSDMRGGRRIHEQISTAIADRSRLVVVLSESSMASDWVATEIRHAVDIERRTGERKLFPIRLAGLDEIRRWRLFDADAGEDLARRIREYHIPDFSGWRDELAFSQAVTRLCEDLRPDA